MVFKFRFSFSAAILIHINNTAGNLQSINNELYLTEDNLQDTSWISVLMAYISVRGVVQWIFNFWIVKDNYFEGLAFYRTYYYVRVFLKISKIPYSRNVYQRDNGSVVPTGVELKLVQM